MSEKYKDRDKETEEIVLRIQAGEKELIMPLWNKVKGFVAMRAGRYYYRFNGKAEMDDYMQSGFIALMITLKQFDYDKHKGFFLVELGRNLSYEFRGILGQRGYNHNLSFDPLFDYTSIDASLSEDNENQTLSNLFASEDAEQAFNDIIEHISAHQDVKVVCKQMNLHLSNLSQNLIIKYYLNGISSNVSVHFAKSRNVPENFIISNELTDGEKTALQPYRKLW